MAALSCLQLIAFESNMETAACTLLPKSSPWQLSNRSVLFSKTRCLVCCGRCHPSVNSQAPAFALWLITASTARLGESAHVFMLGFVMICLRCLVCVGPPKASVPKPTSLMLSSKGMTPLQKSLGVVLPSLTLPPWPGLWQNMCALPLLTKMCIVDGCVVSNHQGALWELGLSPTLRLCGFEQRRRSGDRLAVVKHISRKSTDRTSTVTRMRSYVCCVLCVVLCFCLCDAVFWCEVS